MAQRYLISKHTVTYAYSLDIYLGSQAYSIIPLWLSPLTRARARLSPGG